MRRWIVGSTMDRSEFRLSAQAQEFIGFLVDFFIPIKWLDLRRF